MSQAGLARTNGRPERVRAIDIAGRTPPNAIETERAVIAAVLMNPGEIDSIADILRGEHFYGDANRRIYATALDLRSRGQPTDIRGIADALHDKGEIETVGGVAYLSKLIDETPGIGNIVPHAERVIGRALVRRAAEVCQLASGEAYSGGYIDVGPRAWLERVLSDLYDLTAERGRKDASLLYDVLAAEVAKLGDGKPADGIHTGYVGLDAMTAGMHAGELLVLAGRPGQGKTALATGIAVHVAMAPQNSERLGVMVFSLEMSREELGRRMLCSEGRIDLNALRHRTLGAADFDRLTDAGAAIGQAPIWIDDTAAIGLVEMRAKIRRKQHEFDRAGQRLGLVVVDYLQLMDGEGQNREQEISSCSRGMKAIAKDLRVPILALAQLNREIEKRSGRDRRPRLSDLRESGAIEQDADVVAFVHRPETYLPEGSAERRRLQGYAEVFVAKQRNGPTGRAPLTYHDRFTRFENRAADAWAPDDEDDDAKHAKGCRCARCK